MGNRYTKTTLTKREQETIEGCYHKILNIWARRRDNANEMPKPINRLSRILDNIIILNDEVASARRQIELEKVIE